MSICRKKRPDSYPPTPKISWARGTAHFEMVSWRPSLSSIATVLMSFSINAAQIYSVNINMITAGTLIIQTHFHSNLLIAFYTVCKDKPSMWIHCNFTHKCNSLWHFKCTGDMKHTVPLTNWNEYYMVINLSGYRPDKTSYHPEDSWHRSTVIVLGDVSVHNKPSKQTQPGHPSVARDKWLLVMATATMR